MFAEIYQHTLYTKQYRVQSIHDKNTNVKQ